jgi:hypothetical protein
MRRLDRDPALGRQLGLEALRVMKERFSPEVHLEGLMQTYSRSLVDRSGSG